MAGYKKSPNLRSKKEKKSVNNVNHRHSFFYPFAFIISFYFFCFLFSPKLGILNISYNMPLVSISGHLENLF